MDLQLSGVPALVLGASRGLGYATATALAREGARLLISGRDPETLAPAAAALKDEGADEARYVAADLSERDAPQQLAEAVEAELGHAAVLIANTGGPPPGPIAETGREVWEQHFQTMVGSVIDLTTRLLPEMRRRGFGRVVTVTSTGVVQPIPNLGLSNGLRSSLVGWSKTLANEVAADGVTVNVLAPGRIATVRSAALDRWVAERDGLSEEEVRRRTQANIPAGRYGDPQEFGDTAAFLASPRASYITGSVLRVDGGLVKAV